MNVSPVGSQRLNPVATSSFWSHPTALAPHLLWKEFHCLPRRPCSRHDYTSTGRGTIHINLIFVNKVFAQVYVCKGCNLSSARLLPMCMQRYISFCQHGCCLSTSMREHLLGMMSLLQRIWYLFFFILVQSSVQTLFRSINNAVDCRGNVNITMF